ncbi:MAG TPA: O-antigen ligase family protein [Verrucomicrobiae bacterium]|jgi:O-antigen ligase|nr:O-antigen ligase family protein [Verrucomicrobiae bacterium]
MRARRKKTEIDPRLLVARIDDILLYGTFGLLMFGPLAFGAVETWSIFVLEAGAAALMLLWCCKQKVAGELKILWNPLFSPMLAFGALILVQIVFRVSAYAHDTFSTALLYAAYAMLCFLSSQTLIRSSQAKKMALIFALYGFAVAAMALMQGIAPNGKLLWLRQPRLGGWIYGSYVNHNHYAGLMELLVPIPLVLSLSRLVPEKERIAAGVAAAIMTGTIFLSGSRGGMLAIFAEFVFLATILLRQKKTARFAVGIAAFAVVLTSMLMWLGGKELSTRISSVSREAHTEISGGMRLSIDRDSLRMFRQKPIFGWGLGTFPVVYPQFRSFYTNFFVNEAHDDYMQLLTEFGIAGFAITLWFLVVLYRTGFRKLGNWTHEVSGAVTVACMMGVTGILVHSFVDFNLQVPANAALFYVLGTMAASPRLLQKSKKRKPAPASEPEVLPTSEVV